MHSERGWSEIFKPLTTDGTDLLLTECCEEVATIMNLGLNWTQWIGFSSLDCSVATLLPLSACHTCSLPSWDPIGWNWKTTNYFVILYWWDLLVERHFGINMMQLMRLFKGEIKTDILNSTYCSISKERFDTKMIFIPYSY